MEKPALRKIIDRDKEALEHARCATEHTHESRDYCYPTLASGLDYYDRMFEDSGGMANHVKKAIEELPAHNKVRVLDYGCGKNTALRELRNVLGNQDKLELIGVSAGDPREEDEKAMDVVNDVQFINLESSSVKSAIPDENKYDLIVSKTTFIHIPDPLRAVKQLYSLLNVGGELRIDLDINYLADILVDEEGKGSKDRVRILEDILKQQGFDIEITNEGIKLKRNDNRPLKMPVKYAAIERGQILYKLMVKK